MGAAGHSSSIILYRARFPWLLLNLGAAHVIVSTFGYIHRSTRQGNSLKKRKSVTNSPHLLPALIEGWLRYFQVEKAQNGQPGHLERGVSRVRSRVAFALAGYSNPTLCMISRI
jgi:hypothetical protein